MVLQSVRLLGRSILVAVGLASCGDNGPTNLSPPITALSIVVTTPEVETGRFLLVIGESGLVRAYASGPPDLFGETSRDPGRVSYESSAPSVVSVSPTSGTQVTLVARAPGSATITGRAQGLVAVADRPIVVTSAPLPVDAVQVGLAPVSSGIETAYDAKGVLHMTIPVRTGAALWLTITRAGATVTRIPFTLGSSDPGVARVDYDCLPVYLDATCGTFSQWGWVSGVASGHATVLVTVRNGQASFVVDVP